MKLICGVTTLLFLISLIGTANAFTPTAEQVQRLKQLTPAQQKELAQQYGVNLDQLSQGTNPAQPNLQETQANTTDLHSANSNTFTQRNTNPDTPPSIEHAQTIKPFGYDLFNGQPNTFTPASDIPPPDSYVLGPGDNLVVQLYGKENNSYSLTINRDGQIQFPEIGPINLAGLSFHDARILLTETILQQTIGVKANITMGSLRSIRIFVLGEANHPGSYTISSLSTMTNALFVSRGISNIGSLRNIQLKRRGRLITTLDLYDLLLKGDTSKDSRLLPGDVIFIPPIGETVTIKGEVKRPAIYELKGKTSFKEAIQLAGGFKPTAYTSASRIERINTNGERTIINMDLNSNEAIDRKVKDADSIEIFSILATIEEIVTLEGHVERPGSFAWKPAMTISDIISDTESLLPQADLQIALIERQMGPTQEKSAIIFNLGEEINNQNNSSKIKLKSQDIIYVFDLKTPRAEQLEPLIKKLQLQANKQRRKQTIQVTGHVRFPGEYPLSADLNTGDAILLAGGLTDNAYSVQGEITRITYNYNEEQQIEHINVDLTENEKIRLIEEDQLHIKRLPNWLGQETVTIEGEVRFPGKFKIKRGETLAEVVERAGGLNEWAYPEAAIFTREELKNLEAQRLKELRNRLESEIAATNIEQQTTDQKIAMQDAEELLASLNEVRPIGRMVIDLSSELRETDRPIELKNGDRLHIPRQKQAVTVVGEVQFPTSHIYNPKLGVQQYIDRSGGITQKADKGRVYVVKANGRVFLPEESKWFKGNDHKIQAGDTIVVPLDADRIKPLTLWTNVSQILYQIALGAAAVASF